MNVEKKNELPAILPLSVKSPENITVERRKFDLFKPATVDFFHERLDSEPRVGLCAPELEISTDRKQESMARVKIMKMKTPRSRRKSTI
jgi:hypothetical protein